MAMPSGVNMPQSFAILLAVSMSLGKAKKKINRQNKQQRRGLEDALSPVTTRTKIPAS